MSGPKLDSAGAVKLKVLEEALIHLQRIHGLVEQYAMLVKKNQSGATFLMNIRRQLPSLAANLKSQFGMVSEQVTGVFLASSRGASEAIRVRTLREGVAAIRQGIEIAHTQTLAKHTVSKDTGGGGES